MQCGAVQCGAVQCSAVVQQFSSATVKECCIRHLPVCTHQSVIKYSLCAQQVLKLCSEQLSAQVHYDYGMRAVNSALMAAGALRQEMTDNGSGSGRTSTTGTVDQEEERIVLRAIVEVNAPKFTDADLPLFHGLLSDLFPSIQSSGIHSSRESQTSALDPSGDAGTNGLPPGPPRDLVHRVRVRDRVRDRERDRVRACVRACVCVHTLVSMCACSCTCTRARACSLKH